MRTILAFALALLLASCQSTGAAAEVEIVNKTCPIMAGGAVDPEMETVSVGGYKVGFCCDGCRDEFLEWPENKQQEFMQAALDAR